MKIVPLVPTPAMSVVFLMQVVASCCYALTKERMIDAAKLKIRCFILIEFYWSLKFNLMSELLYPARGK